MIRSEELLDKLIADLHFHNYLEITGNDIIGQKRNVVATKPKIEVINRYIDDVFIDYFFRSHHFKPIIVPKCFYGKKYTNEGLMSVQDDIEINLNNVYDRYTFIHIINLLFSNNNLSFQEISPSNLFLNGFLLKERIFAPYCRCSTPIMEIPHTEVLEQYLDFLYGSHHSLFNPTFRAEAVRNYGLHYQKNWTNYTLGKTNYGMRVLHNRAKDYIRIKDSHVFGDYSVEDVLFLYSVLAEKVQLQEDNLLSYISLYCESFHDDDNVINQFDRFEKGHTNYHVIEPFISIKDLYLRFTSISKSKAFAFTPVNYQVVEIRQFRNKEIRTIFSDNPLPLPYYYDEIEKKPLF